MERHVCTFARPSGECVYPGCDRINTAVRLAARIDRMRAEHLRPRLARFARAALPNVPDSVAPSERVAWAVDHVVTVARAGGETVTADDIEWLTGQVP
jgi:hypothetical protein